MHCTSTCFIIFTDFDASHINVAMATSTPPPVVGESVNLTCTATLPERLTAEPTSVRWTYDLGASEDVTKFNKNASVAPLVRDGNTFISILTIDSVKTTDARDYNCHVTVNVFNAVERQSIALGVMGKFVKF